MVEYPLDLPQGEKVKLTEGKRVEIKTAFDTVVAK
jgi:hypothetical protein